MVKLAEVEIGVEYAKGTDDQKTKIHSTAKELYLATCYFWGLANMNMADSSKTHRTSSSKT